MSNSGGQTGFSKCFILFMAVIVLVQGILYFSLSVWGILKQCPKGAIDISRNPLQFTMNLIYFLSEYCGNPTVKVSETSEIVTLYVDFKKAESVNNRTFIFFIIYAVISSLWVATSLAVITALCRRLTKTINRLCFWPWFLLIMMGSIVDAAATGYHIYDIMNTTSVAKTFKYLSVSTDEKNMEILSNFGAYFVIPAVIMTCISSRLIFVWLLNIFGSSFCLSLSSTLSKRNSSKENATTKFIATAISTNTNLKQESFQEDLAAQTQQQQLSRVARIPNSPIPHLINRSLQRQSSKNSQTNSKLHNEPSPTAVLPTLHNVALSSKESQTNTDAEENTSKYQLELSLMSPLNNRYSTANEICQVPMQNQIVSEELRGQLPWSYTGLRTPASKKPEVYPNIPAPDYGQ